MNQSSAGMIAKKDIVARAAKIVVLDSNINVLVLRRSGTHPTKAFHDDLPGGVIEEGEDVKTGLVREIMEETGIEVNPSDIQKLQSLVEEFYEIDVYRELYIVRLNQSKPEVKISWEHDKFEWRNPDINSLEKPYQEMYTKSLQDGLIK